MQTNDNEERITTLEQKIETKAEKNDLAENNRSLKALWKLNEGQTYSVEEKVETGVNVAPSGAEYMSVDEVHGKSEQDTTNGYQLLEDKYCNFEKGKAASTTLGYFGTSLKFDESLLLEAGDYSISFDMSANNSSSRMNAAQVNRTGTTVVSTYDTTTADPEVKRIKMRFTLPEDAQVPSIYFQFYYKAPVEEYTTIVIGNLMLEKGSVAHDFEPFTGGIPSPNSEFPQSIHSVEEIHITKYGRNLCLRNEGETSNVYNAHNLIPCKKGDTFYVYGEWYGLTSQNMWANVFAKANDTNKNNAIGSNTTLVPGVVKKITVSHAGYFGVCYSAGVSTYTVKKMMVSKHPFTTEEYEDYRKDEYTITPPRALNGTETLKDKMDAKQEVYVFNFAEPLDPTKTVDEQKLPTPVTVDIASDDLAILKSLENIPATHTIIVTDQDGNDASYLLQYIINLKEVNQNG